MLHEIKIRPEYFNAVRNSQKTFEVRRNDRNYQVGDELLLQEFDGENYTGKTLLREITYILQGGHYGVNPEYVAMSIKPI